MERFWMRTRRDEALASQSPWHFEAVMGYAEHVFEEPPEPTQAKAADTRQEYRERDEKATEDLIAALEAAVQGNPPTAP